MRTPFNHLDTRAGEEPAFGDAADRGPERSLEQGAPVNTLPRPLPRYVRIGNGLFCRVRKTTRKR